MHVLPDMSTLLHPISEECPTGFDLRERASAVPVYQSIRQARMAARTHEREALAGGEVHYFAFSQWTKVAQLIEPVLRNDTKDLELCAWYIEALVRLHGFRGIEAGYCLAQSLITRFGQQLFPPPDDEGLSAQLTALVGLSGFGVEGPLIAAIRSLPVTIAAPPGPVSAWQCESIFQLKRLGQNKKGTHPDALGLISPEALEALVAQGDDSFYRQLLHAIDDAINAYSRFEQSLERYAQAEPQPTKRLLDTLVEVRGVVRYLISERLERVLSTPPDSPVHADDINDFVPSVSEPQQTQDDWLNVKIDSRQCAITLLDKISHYFRETEPHSPISYVLSQAKRWSTLPLDVLIEELIPDAGARKQFQSLAGMLPREKDKA